MKIKNYVVSFSILLFTMSCNKGDNEIEINPLNRFSYEGKVYQTPHMGIVTTGEVSNGVYEHELILLSGNHTFIKVSDSQYDIKGDEGPIVNFKIHTSESEFIPTGTYSLLENQTNKLHKASTVLRYTTPGSFKSFIILKDGYVDISEVDGKIEVNYLFFESSSNQLTGFFITDLDTWMK